MEEKISTWFQMALVGLLTLILIKLNLPSSEIAVPFISLLIVSIIYWLAEKATHL